MSDAELIDYTDPDTIARQNIAPNAGCNIDGKFYDVRNLVHLASSQADRIEALTTQNQTWQRNSRETFDAMVAMRNSINEHLPMPSLESDLLQGPENSVFCAAVAEAVVSEVHRLRAKVARLEGALVDHNDLLRSALSIAKREGVDGEVASTNWDAYYNRVAVVLKRHHQIANEARATLAEIKGESHE